MWELWDPPVGPGGDLFRFGAIFEPNWSDSESFLASIFQWFSDLAHKSATKVSIISVALGIIIVIDFLCHFWNEDNRTHGGFTEGQTFMKHSNLLNNDVS